MKKWILIILSIFTIYSCEDGIDPNKPAWNDCDQEDTELEILEQELAYTGTTLKYLVVHCTATSPENIWTPEDLIRFFKEERGWSRPGYHYYITYDGSIYPLWDVNLDSKLTYSERVNGSKGDNHHSLHVSYQGGSDKYGRPKDTRTKEQEISIKNIERIVKNAIPNIQVVPHYHLNPKKACPSYYIPVIK